MNATPLPPRKELSLKQSGRKPQGERQGIYRITLAGRSFVTLHLHFPVDHDGGKCLAAKHFPLPPKPIREWLASQRRQGHFAYARTSVTILNANLFGNVPLSSALPYVADGPTTYLFADVSVAVLFKLTFGGVELPDLQIGT